MFPQARFEIALDRAQGAGLQILACVGRHSCAALAALDPQVRADLPDLDTSHSLRMRRKLRLVILSPLYRVPAISVKTTRHINSGPQPE